MQKIKGIAREIVEILVNRSNQLSQGRSVGAFGFVNSDGYVDRLSELVDGGINGLPFRQLLSKVVEVEGLSLVEAIERLSPRAVVISTDPGKTGIIVSTGSINIFNLPVINIGIKDRQSVGVGYLVPKPELFDLATRSEEIQIEILGARSIDEEREMMKASARLRLKYLEISSQLPEVDLPLAEKSVRCSSEREPLFPRLEVKSLDLPFAQSLIEKSLEVEQGREVACMGVVNGEGHVVKGGELVVGGMGYVPSRLLASSITDVDGISLRQAYIHSIPAEVAIVHTHSGGTGVMHMGDAMAGPGTWGRPIIAIGHDKKGEMRGATVIEARPEVGQLADEHEELGQAFYQADSPARESEIRKRQFGIAQEYTDLCDPIEIKDEGK